MRKGFDFDYVNSPKWLKVFGLPVLMLAVLTSFAPKKVTWLALGDSITYLNDHPNETGNRISKGYMSLISEKYPGIEYINKGFNGWTSVKIAENIDKLGLTKADVYTVFLGTNDWWQGKPAGTLDDYIQSRGAGTISGAFRIILDHFRQLNPDAQIIIISPLQRGDFVYINSYKNNAFGSYREKAGQKLEEVVSALEQIARHERIKFVDLYHRSGITLENMVRFKRLKNPQTGAYQDYKYPDYIDVPFHPEEDEYPYPKEAIDMTYDGLHPSDKGYEAIASLLEKKWKGIKKSR